MGPSQSSSGGKGDQLEVEDSTAKAKVDKGNANKRKLSNAAIGVTPNVPMNSEQLQVIDGGGGFEKGEDED